jgi:acyl-CoA thioesterase FadM
MDAEIPLSHDYVEVTLRVETVGRSSITLGHQALQAAAQ